jgi:hypothetical protein
MCSTEVNVLDTREVDGIEHRVYLVQDSDCESPRETDTSAGRIVAPSDRYEWPMEDGDTVTAYRVAQAIAEHHFHVVARWLRAFHGAQTVLPLYSDGPEGRPDAGHEDYTPECGNFIGVTFDQPSTRKVTGIGPDHMPVALQVDVSEFSEWATGECYGYVIEKAADEPHPDCHAVHDCDQWEQVDSLWGMVGHEYARDEAIRALNDL